MDAIKLSSVCQLALYTRNCGFYFPFEAFAKWSLSHYQTISRILIYTSCYKMTIIRVRVRKRDTFPDSKFHGGNMVPTWVLSAPNGPHVGPMDLAIRAVPFQNGKTRTNNSLKQNIVRSMTFIYCFYDGPYDIDIKMYVQTNDHPIRYIIHLDPFYAPFCKFEHLFNHMVPVVKWIDYLSKYVTCCEVIELPLKNTIVRMWHGYFEIFVALSKVAFHSFAIPARKVRLVDYSSLRTLKRLAFNVSNDD